MRNIYCYKLKKNLEGLDVKFYPGDIGDRIFNHISKEAWAIWLNKQTMIINEKSLDMSNPVHRNQIESLMVDFLFNNKDVTVQGYVPEK